MNDYVYVPYPDVVNNPDELKYIIYLFGFKGPGKVPESLLFDYMTKKLLVEEAENDQFNFLKSSVNMPDSEKHNYLIEIFKHFISEYDLDDYLVFLN